MKQKKIWILFIVVILIIILSGIVIWNTKGDWEYNEYGEGYFSENTYFDGGTGIIFYEGQDLKYKCIWNPIKGKCYVDILNEKEEVVYHITATEYLEEEVDFAAFPNGNYYIHAYTEEGTEASFVDYFAVRKTYGEKFLIWLDKVSGGKIYGESY